MAAHATVDVRLVDVEPVVGLIRAAVELNNALAKDQASVEALPHAALGPLADLQRQLRQLGQADDSIESQVQKEVHAALDRKAAIFERGRR